MKRLQTTKGSGSQCLGYVYTPHSTQLRANKYAGMLLQIMSHDGHPNEGTISLLFKPYGQLNAP